MGCGLATGPAGETNRRFDTTHVRVAEGAARARHVRRSAPLALMLVTAAALAGCGGGSGTSSSSTPAKAVASTAQTAPSSTAPAATAASQTASVPSAGGSPKDLVANADAICGRINTEFADEHPNNATMPEVERVAARRAGAEEAALIELRRLRAPRALARPWQQILAYRLSRVQNLRALAEYAASSDERGMAKIVATGESLKRKLLAAASDAGFNACAEAG